MHQKIQTLDFVLKILDGICTTEFTLNIKFMFKHTLHLGFCTLYFVIWNLYWDILRKDFVLKDFYMWHGICTKSMLVRQNLHCSISYVEFALNWIIFTATYFVLKLGNTLHQGVCTTEFALIYKLGQLLQGKLLCSTQL